MDQILTAVTVAAACMVLVAVMMWVVCSRFLSAVNRMRGGDGSAIAPAMPAGIAPPPYSPPPVAPPPVNQALNLHGVDERTASMLMAIVADEVGVPPDEMRFLSIKEC